MGRSDPGFSGLTDHLPRLRRVALRMLGNPQEAEEAVQEACLRAIRARASFNGDAQVSTWLHAIVVRCALDQLRGRRRDQRVETGFDELMLHGVVASVADGPFEEAEKREMLALVKAAIQNIPDGCRETFVLTQMDGYSYLEAAHQQGVPRGTIASRVHRAKQVLLDILGDTFVEEINDDQ